MRRDLLIRGTLAGFIATLLVPSFSTPANAHCEVGSRIFTATLTFDDPCVNDELAFPTISAFGTGDNPSAQELQIGGSYTKTITEYFGVSLGLDTSQGPGRQRS
jgi:hypothetical protein